MGLPTETPGQRPPWTETYPWTESPLDRDPWEGTWDQAQRPPEGTWDQAGRQEVTSYRDPPVNRMTDTCF